MLWKLVAPVAWVKRIEQPDRVWLRPQGWLLQPPNRRRAMLRVGGVFRLVPRDATHLRGRWTDGTLLRIDRVDQQGVLCRIESRVSSPLTAVRPDQVIAIGLQSLNAGTRFVFHPSSPQSPPLEGLHVRDLVRGADAQVGPGSRPVEPLDKQGSVSMRADGKLHWLELMRKTVPLERWPVLPGSDFEQTIDTGISRSLLADADRLAECRADVEQLLAEKGLAAHASPADEPWKTRIAGLRKQLSKVRQLSDPRLASQWRDLESALDKF